MTSPDMVIRVNDDQGNALEEYRFDPKKFLNAEAILLEKTIQLTWPEVMIGLNHGRVSAVTGVLWLLRKRKDPKLKFGDVVFNTGDLEVIDPDTDERYDGGAEPLPEVDLEADEDEATGDPKDPAPSGASPETS